MPDACHTSFQRFSASWLSKCLGRVSGSTVVRAREVMGIRGGRSFAEIVGTCKHPRRGASRPAEHASEGRADGAPGARGAATGRRRGRLGGRASLAVGWFGSRRLGGCLLGRGRRSCRLRCGLGFLLGGRLLGGGFLEQGGGLFALGGGLLPCLLGRLAFLLCFGLAFRLELALLFGLSACLHGFLRFAARREFPSDSAATEQDD